jgi:hypothetical protein
VSGGLSIFNCFGAFGSNAIDASGIDMQRASGSEPFHADFE